MASQTKEQWPGYMKEVYRILKHDGWIQCVEFEPFYKCDDGTVPEGAALWKVNYPPTSLTVVSKVYEKPI